MVSAVPSSPDCTTKAVRPATSTRRIMGSCNQRRIELSTAGDGKAASLSFATTLYVRRTTDSGGCVYLANSGELLSCLYSEESVVWWEDVADLHHTRDRRSVALGRLSVVLGVALTKSCIGHQRSDFVRTATSVRTESAGTWSWCRLSIPRWMTDRRRRK